MPDCNPVIDGTWKNYITDFGAVNDGVTDCDAATNAWLAWAIANDGSKLYIPPGSYFFATVAGELFFNGVNTATISGYGAIVSRIILGSILLLRFDYTHSGRFQSTVVGATSLTLVTASEISRFSVGQWILITGLGLQDTGYPPNFQYNEYRQITGITGSTMSWTDPLNFQYLSTWPENDHALAVGYELGGPATVYAMSSAFAGTKTCVGLRTTQLDEVTTGGGESMFICGMTFDGVGPAPSMAKSFVIQDTAIGSGNEVDKAVEYMEYNNVTGGTIQMQSASITQLSLIDSTITQMQGTGQNCTIENSTVGSVTPGPASFGHGISLTVNNSTITTALQNGSGFLISNLTFLAGYGTFRVLRDNRSHIMQFAVPGQKYYFAFNNGTIYNRADGTGLVTTFKVTRVYEDGTYVYMDTDLGGVLPTPTFQGGNAANFYIAYGAATITQYNSGPADLTQFAAPPDPAASTLYNINNIG